MTADKLLSPARETALLRRLDAAARHARQRGEHVLCVHRERLADVPSLLDVFEHAERRAADRFFAARPARGFELVAVGCMERIRCTSDEPWSELRQHVERYAAMGAAEAWWVGGVSFDPDPSVERAPHWRPFGAGSFALPELAILRRGNTTILALATWVEPGSVPEKILARLAGWLAKPGPVAMPSTKLRLQADANGLSRYRAATAHTLDSIRAGAAEKVVLACEERHAAPPAWRPSRALRGSLQTHPDGLSFAQGIGDSTFLGATPELLVRVDGLHLESAAVAATTRRDTSLETEAALAQALRSSSKELREHHVVVAAIRRALEPLCTKLDVPQTPKILHTGMLQHLHTPIEGRLARPTHVLDVAARLHPTPALGGHPHAAALDLIRAHEGFDRGWYAGPIGWLDASGAGELYVALRCALAEPQGLHLFAGSGLVSDSDPDCETSETGLKLRSIREALDLW